MRRKLAFALGIVMILVLAAPPADANVIPENPRGGSTTRTRMRCFVGPVTFTMVGSGTQVVVGTATAGSDGWAQLDFTAPALPAGAYTMVGTGAPCPGNSGEVRVPFVLRAAGAGDPGTYLQSSCVLGVTTSTVQVGASVTVNGSCFQGTVRFAFRGIDVGSAQAAPDGTVSFSFVVPDAPPGDHLVSAIGARGDGSAVVLSTSLTVERTVITPTTTTVPPTTTTTPAGSDGNAPLVTAPRASVPTEVLGATEERPAASPAVATPAPARSRAGALAFTGGDAASLVRIGVVVVAVGGLLLAGSRRRSA